MIKKFINIFFRFNKKVNNIPNEEKINFNGEGVINFIDVGSAGLLPEPWYSNPTIIKRLIKFEPRDSSHVIKNVTTLNVALFDSNKFLPFYIYKGFNHTGSSLFEQNTEYVQNNFEDLRKRGPSDLAETWFDRSQLVKVEQLSCYRLEDILKKENIDPNIHFIKIDAQGAEFQILKGAEAILQSTCIGLHLELFTIPLYKNIALLPEVTDYLNNLGFKLVKKFESHGSFDSQNDCIFLKLNTSDNERLSIIKSIYKINL